MSSAHKPGAAIVGRSLVLVVLLLARPAAGQQSGSGAEAAGPPRTREFQLDYAATIVDLPPGASLRVWLPAPKSSEHQHIRDARRNLPGGSRESLEPRYGNRILYFETLAPASGALACGTSYRVTRHEVRGLPGQGGRPALAPLTPEQRALFLAANAKVPVSGKPLELLRGLRLSPDPLTAGRQLYDRVDEHLRYDKSQPGYGQGDVLWACDSRVGNCSDFHSLFISLARAHGLPARFEMGFPLPPERGEGPVSGYHCWAFFYVDGHGWTPVDISEADKQPAMKEYYFGNLTEDRVAFGAGRDIDLVPRQAGPPLNFFIYPYVEVGDRPWPQEKIRLHCHFADVD